MITAQQTRAARALLGWTQEMLADRATVSLTALKRMESVNGERVFESTEDRVRRTLEAAGRVFINSGTQVGVMMDVSRKPREGSCAGHAAIAGLSIHRSSADLRLPVTPLRYLARNLRRPRDFKDSQ